MNFLLTLTYVHTMKYILYLIARSMNITFNRSIPAKVLERTVVKGKIYIKLELDLHNYAIDAWYVQDRKTGNIDRVAKLQYSPYAEEDEQRDLLPLALNH